jgi:uncharacterized YigZ family protein
MNGAMTDPLFTLERVETFAQDIKKSRFIAVAAPVASEQAAKVFLAAQSDPRASHNCWAWRVGQLYRFHDDGEPSGTAGKPILQAIDGQSLDNVAVVVTRWFGGVLLGSGGLVRAYGGTAAACLKAAAKVAIVPIVQASIVCDFSDLARVKAKVLALAFVRLDGESFLTTGAELSVSLPAAEAAAIVRLVADLTSGRAATSFKD